MVTPWFFWTCPKSHTLRTDSEQAETEIAESTVLPGLGERPLSPTCPATLLLKGRLLAVERELVELRVLMVIEVGIGGFGDKETKDEARDAAVVDAEVSITDSDISKAKTTTKEKRRENEGGGDKIHHTAAWIFLIRMNH